VNAGGETWLVIGASSAIARAFAREAAAAGADVVLAGRDRTDLETTAGDIAIRHRRRASVVDFDAADFAGHATFMAAVREAAGPGTLNIFLAFGVMPAQADIDADPELVRRVADTNFTGALSVLHAAAPLFEAQKRGAIVVLGSVAGDRGRKKNYVYGATKAGLATYLQGLRARLFPHGVSVTTIKPGFVDTGLTFGQPGMFLVASPRDVARASLAAARRGQGDVYVPWFWWGIMAIIRNIPERIFKKMSI
jgi:decaprenylphospho-beta-D-erythro-pentofuranosid-2-ulose 2-reductase